MIDIVERAEKLLSAIGPVQWSLRDGYIHPLSISYRLGGIRPEYAEFIAAAPELVDDLIAEVERLQETAKQAIAERDEANAAVERVRELAEQLAAPTVLTGQKSIVGRAIAEGILNAIRGTTSADELGVK